MVNKEKIVNKKGETLKTKEKGEVLFDYTFEVGDVFIPSNNSMLVRKADTSKGILYDNYKLKCKVLGFQDEEDIFVSLTPSQANTISSKLKEEIVLNQHLFCAYEYVGKDSKKYVGIGFKKQKLPAKKFDDFANILEEEK